MKKYAKPTKAIIAINWSKTLNCINLLEYFLLVSPPLNKVPIPRIKTKPTAMILMAIIGWMVHFCDMSYNIMPLIHETSDWTKFIWIDLGCILFMGELCKEKK